MKRIYKIIIITAAMVPVTVLLYLFHFSKPDMDIKKATFKSLIKLRNDKKEEVFEYFKKLQSLAIGVKNDNELLSSFKSIKDNNYKVDADLEYKIDYHFVMKYRHFYDLLFVDGNGFIFHSVKKESDYKTNIFNGKLSNTELAKRLKENKDNQFIEFRYYQPSGEPAAFFAVSINQNNEHMGWLILQCAVNTVNAILTDIEGFGKTTEVYLVNRDKLMLTNSRFLNDSTILKLKIDTVAVKEALESKSGERIIEDYRGIRVFSSYEKFQIFGTKWIIISEIDEDEIITQFYRKYKGYLKKKIISRLNKNLPEYKTTTEPVNSISVRNRVDVNEYARAEAGQNLTTSGILTCTAVGIINPDRFGYLAHISPTDQIYVSGPFIRYFLNRENSDFLGNLIKRIKHYEVYPYELKRLKFLIVANHIESVFNTVDKVIDSGVELANIKFLYNPNARSANVSLDMQRNQIQVYWKKKRLYNSENSAAVQDLGSVIKEIINYRG